MGERIAKGGIEIFEAERTLWRLAGALPRGDPLFRTWIITLLNRCLTAGEASPPELIFLPFAVVAAGEEVAGLIGKWPETGYGEDESAMVKLIKEAVKLEISPPADGKP